MSLGDVRAGHDGHGEDGKYVVIFFHGYGANGHEMHDHFNNIARHNVMVSAVVRFAHGPHDVGAGKRGWFRIENLDANDPHPPEVHGRLMDNLPVIHKYIDQVMAHEGIDESRLIFAGFSQGASVAYYAALTRDKPVAGVFCISGGALDQVQGKVRPPIVLVVGSQERNRYAGVPHQEAVYKMLRDRGHPVDLRIIDGQGHDISAKTADYLSIFINVIKSQRRAESISPAP